MNNYVAHGAQALTVHSVSLDLHAEIFMSQLRIIIIAISLMAVTLCSAQDFEVALNINNPINTGSGAVASNIDYGTIASLGIDSVRVNAILGPWSSVDDTTLHSGATWFGRYDEIVDGFLAVGVESYMLIGNQSVVSASDTNTWGYVTDYANAFELVVGHFKDRVSVYETFNEPNNWSNGSSADVEPAYLATMLQEIYLNVKYRDGHDIDPSWTDVTIVSGPILTHDFGGSGDWGGTYWSQTINAGINQDLGFLNWNTVYAATGSYPFDGIGLHIYVEGESDNVANITTKYNQRINSMWNATTALEGASTPKKIWMSELGWNRDSMATYMTTEDAADAVARNLDTAYDLMRADARVIHGNWFSLVDFPGLGNTWGLYPGGVLNASQRHPSWWHLRYQAVIGDDTENTALNAGFEAGSSLTNWTAYGSTGDAQTGPWFNSIQPHSGTRFQGTATNFGQQNGGLYQQFITSSGQDVAASVWVQTHREGGSAGDTTCRIGIDPTGGVNAASGNVVWSEELESEDYWRPLVIEATASAGDITVFLEHAQAASTWNVTCFDDVVVLISEEVPVSLSGLSLY